MSSAAEDLTTGATTAIEGTEPRLDDAEAAAVPTPRSPVGVSSSGASPSASSTLSPSSDVVPRSSTLMTSRHLSPLGGGVGDGVTSVAAAGAGTATAKDTLDLPGTTSSISSTSASAAPIRARANTAPAKVAPGEDRGGGTSGTAAVIAPNVAAVADSAFADAATNEAAVTMMAAEIPTTSTASSSSSSPNRGPVGPAVVVERTMSNDEDEEIRMARAMALAIANNPHLPPEEIRELVGAPKSVVPGGGGGGGGTTATAPTAAATAAAAQLSTRFSSMFQDFDSLIKTGVANATTATQSASASITPMTSSFRIGDNLRKYVGSSSLAVTTNNNTSDADQAAAAVNPSGLEAPSTDGTGKNAGTQGLAEVASQATKVTATSTTTTVTAARTDVQVRTSTISEVASPNNGGGGGYGPSGSVVAVAAAAPPPTTTTTATTTTTTTKTTKAVAPTYNKEGTGGNGAPRPRHPFRKQSNRSPCTVPTDSIVIERQAILTTLSEVSSTDTETAMPMRSDNRAPSPASASTVKNFLPSSFRSAVSGATTNNNNNKKMAQKSAPIRLSSLAWKRRGGMGKYSNLAWELRRIELVNTRILYYRNDSEDDNTEAGQQANNGKGGGDAMSLASEDQNPEAVIVSRRANWLEHAASTWTAPTTNDITSPRGYIDLAKEKAVVNASYGDSGAPSPFAISIKVRGETKWKLCFSSHRTMMQWLAALTDVVVQASVDAYNASLLAAADPANIAAAEANPLFAAPSPPAPPPNPTGGPVDPHRLWMVEPYRIENGGPGGGDVTTNYASAEKSAAIDDLDLKFDGSDSQNDDDRAQTNVSTVSMAVSKETTTKIYVSGLPTEVDASLARESAKEECERAWSIPEGSLMNVGIVVNLALCYVRSSTTSIEAFWYIVVATNVALLLFMTHEPKWESVLERVWGEPSLLQVQPTDGGIPAPDEGSTVVQVHKEAAGAVSIKRKKDFVPVAGSTTVKLKNPRDPSLNSRKQPFAGWCAGSPEIMLVRSHGYLETKAKIPSPGQLYECVGVDIFESPQRYPDMGSRVKLPPTNYADSTGKKTWRMPDIFIVSIALPTDPPKFGRSSSDGGGYTVTVYFRMLEETRDILRRVTADGYDPNTDRPADRQTCKVNAVRLMEEWCRRAPTDPKYQARFKVVPNAHNLDEIGMPAWISKYNGKPFLVKRAGQTGFLYTHPELSCMEFDVSLHPFPYLAKQAICFMKESYFKRILVSFGFCIEGRSDDELPECLIGTMQLCYPDPAVAIQGADFFSGRSPSSFD